MSALNSADTGLGDEDKKLHFPASDRNKDPILDILKEYLKPNDEKFILEFASGSGQHIAHFAPHFQKCTFQPSDKDPPALDSIIAYTRHIPNVLPPIVCDIRHDVPATKLRNGRLLDHGSCDIILNINMIHISSNGAVNGLFRNANAFLKPGGILFTYGPYGMDGTITPQSNINFHRSLIGQNKEWGLRDVKFLADLAKQNNLEHETIHDMPQNNKCLIFRKLL